MHRPIEKYSAKTLILKQRDTKAIDVIIQNRCSLLLNKYSREDKIEVCYQEIERSRENPDPLKRERTIYAYYSEMVKHVQKLKFVTVEHRFLIKYVYLRCVFSRIQNGLSDFEAEITLGESMSQHLQTKFDNLNQIWKSLSPLLQLLYQENFVSILNECVEYKKLQTKTCSL